ncbi:KNL1 protein, partial [Podilymbus podiceps]|nr:KNL1 protein [Podilymbus podiceps]
STGMDTLLHAPIQALVQQTEWLDADAIQRTDCHDTTLIFSDENEMDMTASHTAVIKRNLKNNQADKTEKIDITSFLAGLNSNNGKAEMSKEFRFFPDPTNHSCPSFEQKEDATTVKKINFNEFLISLNSNKKAFNPIEGPDKENVFFDPSHASEDMARSSVEFVYPHEPQDTCDVAKVFGGQEDGMEMTKCQASDVKAMFSGRSVSSETVFRGEKPVVSSKCDDMEITGNYTDVIYNDSTKEMNSSHQKNFEKPVNINSSLAEKRHPAHSDRDITKRISMGKTVSSEEGFKNPHYVDGLHLRGAEEPLKANASEPHKGSSQLPSFLEKSVVFLSGENMDLTGNCAVMVPDYNSNPVLSERKAVPGHIDMEITKTHTAVLSSEINAQDRESVPAISAVPADKTIVFTPNQDDMEITASHTVAVNNNINGSENQE